MNICYVAPDVAVPYFRGASTHVYEVSKNLTKRGHRVSVVSRRVKRSQPRWERIDGFETYRTYQGVAFEPPGSSYSATHTDREGFSPLQKLYSFYLGSYRAFQLGAEVATLMSGRGIDVVLERETAFGAGAVSSSLLGVPMVLEMIGPRVSPMSLKRASRVLAYSARMAGGRIPKEKLELVPAGVDTDRFTPDPDGGARVRRDRNLSGEFVVGYVGTFQRWHGVQDILNALARVRSDFRVRGLLVGPYFTDAMKLSEGLGLKDEAVFTGPIPYEQVPAHINACDVLCAPYDPGASMMRSGRGIGAPLKVLEYMSCGKPVVTTGVPPITEVVDDGRTGLLVPPGDPDSLAEALRSLKNDPARAEMIGMEARKEVVARYSWGSLAKTMEGALRAACLASGQRMGNQS